MRKQKGRWMFGLAVLLAVGTTARGATVDENWDDQITGAAGFAGNVYAVAISSNTVYVGGSFTNIGGVTANHIARWDGNNWYSLGGGVNGTVYSLAVTGNVVYAGGTFTSAQYYRIFPLPRATITVAATNIAAYHSSGVLGAYWDAVGDGFGNTVYALAAGADGVYAGGSFTNSGAVPLQYVAKWNGSSWSALARGVDNTVRSLAVNGNDVYAGGIFSNSYRYIPLLPPIWVLFSAPNVARWDGSSWHSLSNGVNHGVTALAVSGTNLYAGGWFTDASGLAVNHVAKWNGTSWSRLDNGVGGLVHGLAVSGTNVYATGSFLNSYYWASGGIYSNLGTWLSFPVNYIAQWDGSRWQAMGSGLNDIGEAIAAQGDDVYVGGLFTKAGGKPSRAFAHWSAGAPGLWSDAADLGGGWKWLDWFGYFNTNADPWIYHNEHGWLYPYGTDTNSICFWDNAVAKWWWTSATDYPYVYRFSDATWLWYQEGSSNPRSFYNLTAGQWETW